MRHPQRSTAPAGESVGDHASPAPDPAAMPAFARAIRGLAHVPKAEVDAAIAREKAAKKKDRKR